MNLTIHDRNRFLIEAGKQQIDLSESEARYLFVSLYKYFKPKDDAEFTKEFIKQANLLIERVTGIKL